MICFAIYLILYYKTIGDLTKCKAYAKVEANAQKMLIVQNGSHLKKIVN